MRKIEIWMVFSACILTCAASVAGAQSEQWLEYHSVREIRQIEHDIGSQNLTLSEEKPDAVQLPQFNGNSQFFTRWSSPLVQNGSLLIALDSSSKDGPYDRLFIDANGNGHLNDETATTAYRTERGERSYFGPVKVVFELADGPATYHLNFTFYNHTGYRRLYAYSGCWYQGEVMVAGQKRPCVLIDHNANGTFDDKSIIFGQSDRIRIGKKGDRDTRYVGNYIEIDGRLYRPEIARDGAFIKLTEAADVKFGSVQLAQTITEFAAGGENGLFTVKLEKGAGQLPVGKYRIDHWTIQRKDKDNDWKLEGRYFNDKGIFDITADSRTSLNVGEPVVSTLDATKRGDDYRFGQRMQGRLGERIELTRNGGRPRPPKMHIKSGDGSYDRVFSFEYG